MPGIIIVNKIDGAVVGLEPPEEHPADNIIIILYIIRVKRIL